MKKRLKWSKSRWKFNKIRKSRRQKRRFYNYQPTDVGFSSSSWKTKRTKESRSKTFFWPSLRLMIRKRRKLRKIGRISSRRLEKEIFLTRMLHLLKRRRKTKLEPYKLLRMNLRSFRIRFKVTKLRHRNFRNLLISSKTINRSMVLRLHKLTPSIISALSRSSWIIILSQSCKRKTSRLRASWSNSKTSMKL